MKLTLPPLKPLILGLASFLVLGFGVYFLYDALVFRVTSIDPKTVLPTSTDTIIINFNRDLAPKDEQPDDVVVVSPETGINTFFSQNTLMVRLLTLPPEDQPLILYINGIKSVKDEELSREVSYRVEYVPFNELSQAQQDQQISRSDSFQSAYPLSKELPIRAIEYTITYEFPDSDNDKMPIIITVNFEAAASGSGGPTRSDIDYYVARIRDARLDAIDRLEKLGFDHDNYALFFGENYIINEFPGSYLGERRGHEFTGDGTAPD